MLLSAHGQVADFVKHIYNISQEIQNKTQFERKISSKNIVFFLTLCITAMVYFNCLCWNKMQRSTFGRVTANWLSWMFHHAPINWEVLFEASIKYVMKFTGNEGILVIDDTDRTRAKGTTELHGVHKVKDKKTSGYSMAQNLVFLVFVTTKMTIPVGFYFYRPDPLFKKWKKDDEKLRKAKVPKKERPEQPSRNEAFPTKNEIAVRLVEKFKQLFPDATIKSIVADAAYMEKKLVKSMEKLYPHAQIISQIRKNMKVSCGKINRQKSVSVEKYFANKPSRKIQIQIRGNSPIIVHVVNARLNVHSHGRKLHIVALKYENETEYRYLAAVNVSWQAEDIVRIYGYRWLIEVAIEDWKVYCGWGKMAFQQGYDGACRGVYLSFFVDHFLCTHPLQLKQLNSGSSLWTAGSIVRYTQISGVLFEMESILNSHNPKEKLDALKQHIEKYVDFRTSHKHMSGHNIGSFEPQLTLRIKERPS